MIFQSLLTSGGLNNELLVSHFKEKITDLSKTKVAFIITASNGEPGDKKWVLKDLNKLYEIGVAEVDIIDIASLSKKEYLPRLEWADVLWVEGGNTRFLMYHLQKSGLVDELSRLLESRLYVGVSAGSMVMGECLPNDAEKVLYPYDQFADPYNQSNQYLSYVPIHILPHYQSDYMERDEQKVQALTAYTNKPIYALDDSSAIIVENGRIKAIISDGKYKIFQSNR
jgi:dipeptidase E